jgi:hypothetical protein
MLVAFPISACDGKFKNTSTVNSGAEAKATRMMIDRVEEKYDIKPARLVGDTNYGTAPMLDWMVIS